MGYLPVSLCTTAILIFIYIYLSFRVIKNRRRAQVARGSGDDSLLDKSIRAHGNFSEYTPLFLISLALTESAAAPLWLLSVVAFGFVLGRASHAFGISRAPENLKWRVRGMMLTFANLIAVGVLALYYGLAVPLIGLV